MRVKDLETSVRAPCFNMMERKDVNGASSPITDIKYSPPNRSSGSDAVNSNGLLSPPTTPSATTPPDTDYPSSATGSGRFKFFKDGKFILELWHHKNGERMFWVPVTKNSTYWPPTANSASRQESSTSLSVSDDNISVQSSPWQRDHVWKQSAPKKNVNRELEFTMHLLHYGKGRFLSSAIRKKRRKPYDLVKVEMIDYKTNILRKPCKKKYRNKSGKLEEVITVLRERKLFSENLASCRTDPGIVSPRKRILKEMEKVSLEELGNVTKKHRAKSAIVNCSSPSGGSVTATVAKPISSHSINSILSRDEEPSFLRNLLRSPSNDTSYESSSRSTFSTDSPSSDIRMASSNGNTHCSTPIASSLSPPYSSNGIPCPQPIPVYLPPGYMYPSTPSYVSPPPISNHPPPYYSTLPSNNHNPLTVWGFRPISSLARPPLYPVSSAIPSYSSLNSSPWIPFAHSSLYNNYCSVANNATDVPLNLSKHPS